MKKFWLITVALIFFGAPFVAHAEPQTTLIEQWDKLDYICQRGHAEGKQAEQACKRQGTIENELVQKKCIFDHDTGKWFCDVVVEGWVKAPLAFCDWMGGTKSDIDKCKHGSWNPIEVYDHPNGTIIRALPPPTPGVIALQSEEIAGEGWTKIARSHSQKHQITCVGTLRDENGEIKLHEAGDIDCAWAFQGKHRAQILEACPLGDHFKDGKNEYECVVFGVIGPKGWVKIEDAYLHDPEHDPL